MDQLSGSRTYGAAFVCCRRHLAPKLRWLDSVPRASRFLAGASAARCEASRQLVWGIPEMAPPSIAASYWRVLFAGKTQHRRLAGGPAARSPARQLIKRLRLVVG